MAMNNGQRFSQTGDNKVYAEFLIHPRLNTAKTKKEGRPIYDDVPYVRIMAAGDKDNIVMRPVRDSDKMRFPQQWAQFQNKEEQVQEGTPLTEWAGISRSQAEELKAMGIRTVEALAQCPDTAIQRIMGGNGMKQKAKAYMEDAKLLVPIERLNKENQDLRAELESLKAQINAAPSTTVEADVPKRRSRRKVEVDDGEIQVSE